MSGHKYLSMYSIDLPMSQLRSAQIQLNDKKKRGQSIRGYHGNDLTPELLLTLPWWVEGIKGFPLHKINGAFAS